MESTPNWPLVSFFATHAAPRLLCYTNIDLTNECMHEQKNSVSCAHSWTQPLPLTLNLCWKNQFERNAHKFICHKETIRTRMQYLHHSHLYARAKRNNRRQSPPPHSLSLILIRANGQMNERRRWQRQQQQFCSCIFHMGNGSVNVYFCMHCNFVLQKIIVKNSEKSKRLCCFYN